MNAPTSVAATAALLLGLSLPASADDVKPQYSLKDHEARTGSKFRRNVVQGETIPFNLPYEKLTEEQKAILKARYEAMGPNDEPPFPEHGLMDIMKELHEAEKILRVRGHMRLHANINAEGKATSVSVITSVDPRMDMYIAGVLMRTKFKPALCNGVPCAQEYLFAMTFTIEY